MQATDAGIELSKSELKALLGCGPSSVLFTVAGNTLTAYATNTAMSVEAVGSAGSGADSGDWLVDSDFLKACMRQAKAKTTIVLEVVNGATDESGQPAGPLLYDAVFTEAFEAEEGARTVETGRYSWADSAAVAAPQRNPDEPTQLAYSKAHDHAVPCVSLYAEHLAVVGLVAKAAGRGIVDQFIQDSKHKAVGFEVNGATRWRVTVLPQMSDVDDDGDSDVGVTISSGETSVTLTAGELRKAVEVLDCRKRRERAGIIGEQS